MGVSNTPYLGSDVTLLAFVPRGSSSRHYENMTQLFLELGLQSSPDKDTPRTHEMICLGICVNTLSMTLTVPEFRLQELEDFLSSRLHKALLFQRELHKHALLN